MKNTHKFMPDGPADRFWLIHNSIVRYCDWLRGDIASLRSRAMEHIIITASILGIYFGIDAASGFNIGWWGFAGIMCLLVFALPHAFLAVGTKAIVEFRLGASHLGEPPGETEAKTLDALEEIAVMLEKEFMEVNRRYTLARIFFWRLGVPLGIALGVLEWLL